VGVLVHGEGRILFANPVASHLLGASSQAELLGRPILDFVHPGYHDLFHARVRQLRDGATQLPAVEKQFVRLDGSTIDVEVTRIGFTFRGRPAVQMVVRDITERKRTEEARRLLFDAGTTLASSLDHEATLCSVASLAVPAIADWCLVDLVEEDDVLHRLAVAHADPDTQYDARVLRRATWPTPTSAIAVERVVQSGRAELATQPTDADIDGLARDDEQRAVLRRLGVVSYICVPLTAHGRTLGAMTFISTTSGRRFTATELTLAEEIARRAALAVDNARLYREAREANRTKSQFLATMSHELRTPLNAIAGYAELMELEVRGPVSEGQREYLRRIRLNQQHLLGLINDVLSFARLETGRLDFDMVDVPVDETLAAAGAHIEPQLLSRGLQYEYHGGEPACTCRADRDKLRQIVLNLLSNAMKFSPPDGRVTLDWSTTDDTVMIHVADTGRGIPPDKLDLIFEPFVQLDTSFSARLEGTGLGLAISRELARAMGGDVTVESRLGEGSTFTLTLPRH
jgi:PAS domain S-box-containing protein